MAGAGQRAGGGGRVTIVSLIQDQIGEDRLDSLVYAVLGGTLLMVGIITLTRALILRNLVEERDRFDVERPLDRRQRRLRLAANILIGSVPGVVSSPLQQSPAGLHPHRPRPGPDRARE